MMTQSKAEIHMYQSGDYTVSKSSHHNGMWNVYHNQTGHGHALTIADDAIKILYPLTTIGVDKERKYRTYEPGPAKPAPISLKAMEEMEITTVRKGLKTYSVRRRKGL